MSSINRNDCMTADQVLRWLAEMRVARLASSDAAAARLLGVHPNTMASMKANGADRRTALACRALMHRLEPFDGGI